MVDFDFNEVKTVAVIPARGNSKGIPGKNKKLLNGVPLVAYTVMSAMETPEIDLVVLSSEDEEILEIGYQYASMYEGKKFWMVERPAELSLDWVQCDDVVHHVFRLLDLNFGVNPRVGLLLQPTTPLRYVTDIQGALSTFNHVPNAGILLDKPFSPGTVVSGSLVKGWTWQIDSADWITPLGHTPEQRFGRQWAGKKYTVFKENGGIYVFDGHKFMHTRTVRMSPYKAYVIEDPDRYVDIDTVDDWKRTEKHMHESGWETVPRNAA